MSRLREFVAARELGGVVLTTPGAVAWATGGVSAPIDRSAPVDLVWVVVTPTHQALITTEVERDRVDDEYGPKARGFQLVAVPWYDADAFAAAAAEIAERPADALASDGFGAFGHDVADDLVAARLGLGAAERDEVRALGRLAADALGQALRAWRPGRSRDLDIQADVAALLEAAGADAPVLLVGGDDRVRRYRHPVAAGEIVHELAMAVVVARRAGLHVAATRFARAGAPDPSFSERRRQVLAIDDAVLRASTPGATYGAVLDQLAAAYAAAGEGGAWAEHYQGGPIGFAQREFEIAPGQSQSRWYATRVEVGHALAWNPSLSGGAKVEDTYLVTAAGLEAVTRDAHWPTEPGANGGPVAERPAVLEVSA